MKKILKGLLCLIVLLLVVELLIYCIAPVYDFQPPEPFSGEKIFNPYAAMDSLQWKKVNFHFHLRAWGGFTSGRDNTPELLQETYKKMGYDLFCVSDYQRINSFNKESVSYIPCYEHGFGIRKKHQMLIGSRKVLWLDYSLFQNIHHKQYILDLLRPDNDIIAIAHPDWEDGYSGRDMKLLTGYDLIEVLDANWRSVPLWDSALSAGHPAFILADDDSHDIKNPYQIGRCCTFINSATTLASDMVSALKAGNAFGADVYMSNGENFDDKAQRAKEIPVLTSVIVRNDTLFVKTNAKAIRFVFIGQGGKIRKISRFAKEAWYRILPGDTYIRTEIKFYNHYGGPGTIFYLNPVFRYSGQVPDNTLKAEINWPRTWIFRIFAIPSLLFLIFAWFFFRNRKRKAIRISR